MFKKLQLSMMLALIIPFAAFAQNGVVTGTVTDMDGEPVPAANVSLKEITKGNVTNLEGKYTITNVPAGTYTLVVQFVGYKTYEEIIEVGSGILTVDVQLEDDILGLDEVVVSGYGVESKRESTGSVAKVSARDFEAIPVQNTESILQGRAAGVQIRTNSGNPGGSFDVLVRGSGSINAGDAPLYIVDGVQISFANQSSQSDQTPLNSINPQDIESIEVLKDAASAAIYGAQGANGVVIITTKSGRKGTTNITARSTFGYREEISRFNLMEGQEWAQLYAEGYENQFAASSGAGIGDSFVRNVVIPSYGQPAPTEADFSDVRSFDWQDLIFDQGFAQNYNITVSGGNNETSYYIAGGFEETEGHILDSRFRRFNLRTNIDQQFSDRLRGGVNINLSATRQNGICQDGNFINCPVTASSFEPPVSTPFDTTTASGYSNDTRFGLQNNIALQRDLVRRRNNNVQILGNVNATYDFAPWLTMTTLWGLDYRNVRDNQFRPPLAAQADNGLLFEANRGTVNWNTNTVLTAQKTFDEVHNVSGLVGFEYRREESNVFTSTGIGFANGLLSTLNVAATPDGVSGFRTEFRQAGYFTRLKYDYDEKYLLTLTGRYDGSSRFGADERWGFFPSATVGWRISEEDFMQDVSWVEELKLRGGYGTTGNNSIGNFASRGVVSSGGTYLGGNGFTIGSLANNVLTWEEVEELNLGIDAAFFKGRLSASIDAYSRDNNRLLLNRPLPEDTGFANITENVGSITNEGIEVQLNSVNVDRGGFLWTSNFNVAFQRNEITELNSGQDQLFSGSTPRAVGQSQLAIWTPLWAGINPADGRAMWYDANDEITYFPDGQDDRRFWGGGGEEDIVGGFGNTFSYKGLSLDVFLQYSFGRWQFMQQEMYFLNVLIFETGANATYLRDRWQQPGDITRVPRVYARTVAPPDGSTSDPRTTLANNFWEDASYIRLKNVTLSYNLPSSVLEKVNLRGVRLFASGLNLYTWTAFTGLDPEQNSNSFPSALQLNGGIEIQF